MWTLTLKNVFSSPAYYSFHNVSAVTHHISCDVVCKHVYVVQQLIRTLRKVMLYFSYPSKQSFPKPFHALSLIS